jgi:hypothetical protein
MRKHQIFKYIYPLMTPPPSLIPRSIFGISDFQAPDKEEVWFGPLFLFNLFSVKK